MSHFIGYTREERSKIEARAKVLLRNVPCNKGGCANHGGHEFCDRDEAWERAVDEAKDEYYEQRCHEEMQAETARLMGAS